MIINRIYYKNKRLHLGHLQVLYHNNDFAKLNKGKCYAIIDDRYSDITEFTADISYLGLTHVFIVPITTLQTRITDLLRTDPKVYLQRYNKTIKSRLIITNQLETPCYNFQIRYGDQGHLLGYTKSDNNKCGYNITYIFEHILPFIDVLLNVTDICTTLTHNPMNNVHVHKVTPYYIQGLDENKWSIKSIAARKIPSTLLYQFYLLGLQYNTVSTDVLDHAGIIGVINPVEVTIKNWEPKRIEYVFDGDDFRPLTGTVYLERDDIKTDGGDGVSGVRIKYGLTINESGYVDQQGGDEVRWISGEPSRAYFFIDNRVSLGYITADDILPIFHLKDYGYFKHIGYICSVPVFQSII